MRNPYSLSQAIVSENASNTVKELINKGFAIDTIKKNLLKGIDSCNRKLKRDSFDIDATAKKEWLTHQLIAANKTK